MDLSYSRRLPFTSVRVEVHMRRCSDVSPELFKDKRFRCLVEIGGQPVESEDY